MWSPRRVSWPRSTPIPACRPSGTGASASRIWRSTPSTSPGRNTRRPGRTAARSILSITPRRDRSEDVARQILVLEDRLEPLAYVGRVDRDLLAAHLRRVEGDLVEQALHHGVQPASADALGARIHVGSDAGDLADRLVAEDDLHAFGREEGRVLADEGVLGLGQDADEVRLGEGLELHPDGEAALELGDEIRGLGDVEGSRGDEEDVVGADGPVLGVDGRALDDRQEVALHALAGHVGTVDRLPARDLVDLVDEDDARLLDAPDRLLGGGFHVDESCRLLLGEGLERLRDLHARPLAPLGQEVLQPVLQVALDLLHALRRHHLDHGGDGTRHLELDRALVELPFMQHAPELVPRADLGATARALRADRLDATVVAHGWEEEVEQPLLGQLARAHANLLLLLLAHHVDGELGQLADDRLDVAADVADLGELGGLDLDEGRLGELGEPPRDLRLPDAGRADHDDVLGRDLVAQRVRHVQPAPAVAKRDRHRALRGPLADDVAVELRDDLPRGEGGHSGRPSLLVIWLPRRAGQRHRASAAGGRPGRPAPRWRARRHAPGRRNPDGIRVGAAAPPPPRARTPRVRRRQTPPGA